MPTNLTKDDAIDKLMSCSHGYLYDMCYKAHKDQYDFHGYNLGTYKHAELVSWWILHYDWNIITQQWETIIPYGEHYDDCEYIQ